MITLSKKNITEFIASIRESDPMKAVPIILAQSSLRDHALERLKDSGKPRGSLPRGVMQRLDRLGAAAVAECLRGIIPPEFTGDTKALPRHYIRNAIGIAAAKAEAAMEPEIAKIDAVPPPHPEFTFGASMEASATRRITLEAWKQTVGVTVVAKLGAGVGDADSFICADIAVDDPNNLSLKEAGLVSLGDTEINACRNYARANDGIGWPTTLDA